MNPSREQALQFAVMLSSGMPPKDIIPYFFPEAPIDELPGILKFWMRSDEMHKAITQVQGKVWQDLTLDERIRYAIDKHYAEMAYFLYSRNYSELSGADKTKADTCRDALERKLAGMAGKLDALSQFWTDVTTGKVKVDKVSPDLKVAAKE